MQKKSWSRAERLAPLLREVIAERLLRGVKDPRAQGAVVTGVNVSPDLKSARVSWVPMEGAVAEEVQRGLDSVAGFLRHAVGEQLALRYAPRLVFMVDKAVEQGRRVDAILRELDGKPGDEGAGAAVAPPAPDAPTTGTDDVDDG